jgi:hypothetical protein
LKQPLNAPPPGVEAHYQPHQLQENAAALLLLKALVQDTAAHAKPVSMMHSFPLAASPHYVPNPIRDGKLSAGGLPLRGRGFGFGSTHRRQRHEGRRM